MQVWLASLFLFLCLRGLEQRELGLASCKSFPQPCWQGETGWAVRVFLFCMLPSGGVHSSDFPSLLTTHLKNLWVSVGPIDLWARGTCQMFRFTLEKEQLQQQQSSNPCNPQVTPQTHKAMLQWKNLHSDCASLPGTCPSWLEKIGRIYTKCSLQADDTHTEEFTWISRLLLGPLFPPKQYFGWF